MRFEEKLYSLRKHAGLSQEQLADKLEVSRQAVSRWEQGVALPDANNIVEISKIFCVSTDYLLFDEYNYSLEEGSEPLAIQKNSLPERYLKYC